MDRYRAKIGYRIASGEYEDIKKSYDLDSLTRDDLQEIYHHTMEKYKEDKAKYEIGRELKRFLGLDVKKYFIFYPDTFGDELEVSVQKLKEICDKTPGLSYTERMSTDNDFFLFVPINHGPGMEIIDKKNRPPYEMTDLFEDVVCSKREYPHQLIFRW